MKQLITTLISIEIVSTDLFRSKIHTTIKNNVNLSEIISHQLYYYMTLFIIIIWKYNSHKI